MVLGHPATPAVQWAKCRSMRPRDVGGGDMALGYVSNEKRAPGVSLVSQHFSFKTQLPAFWEGWGFSNWKLNKNHLEKETTNRLKPKKC